MIWCEGKNCSRKDFCAYHEHFEYKYPRQILDLSREGSHWEDHGKSYHHYSCGDKAKYYNSYKALGYREDEEYKNSEGTICDDVCLKCEHIDLCFMVLEYAGMVFQPGDRVRFDCEQVKEDPHRFDHILEQIERRRNNE